MDWDDLRYFLSVARHATLTNAATELKVASSTVGRRLAALEKTLGVRLLDRTPEGYASTPAGEEVMAKAELIESTVQGLERSVGDRDGEWGGHVRVACVEGIANHILAPSLPALQKRYPEVVVELVPDARHVSLSMREADIAIRLRQPTQQDVVARCVGRLAYALYASREYVAEHGSCDVRSGCPGHLIVRQGSDASEVDLQGAAQREWFSGLTHRARVAAQTDSHEGAVSVALSGGGIACLAAFRANQESRLLRIDTPQDAPAAEIWTIIHKDNRDVARFRAVREHIVETAKQLDNAILPPPDAVPAEEQVQAAQ